MNHLHRAIFRRCEVAEKSPALESWDKVSACSDCTGSRTPSVAIRHSYRSSAFAKRLSTCRGSSGSSPIGAPTLSEHRVDGTATVAGVVLLTESHASCHAFPDDGAAHFDVFSCKPFDVEAARRYVLRHFGAAELRDSVLKRGPGESRHHVPLVLVRGVR